MVTTKNNGSVSLNTVFHGVATVAVLGIFGMVWGVRADADDLKTDIAVIKAEQKLQRTETIKWRAKVDAALEKK